MPAQQTAPHDLHDYDSVNENIVLEMPINGSTRKVLVRPERNGYVYIIDRTTGEGLSATPYGYINTSTGVDLHTGKLKYAEEKRPIVGKVVRDYVFCAMIQERVKPGLLQCGLEGEKTGTASRES
jgi:hypothetical protein